MKIKIIVLNINDLGGIERVALNKLRMFSSRDEFDSVEIISVNGESDNHQIQILRGSNENNKLYKFCKGLDEDCVVLSLYDRFSIKLSCIRKVFKMRFSLIACQHADYYAHPLLTRLLRYISYHWIDKIVALTKVDKKLYERFFHNVFVIPNSLSFSPAEVTPIHERRIDCAVAGRLVEIKQFDHFLSMANNILRRHPCKTIKVYGDGEEYQNLKLQLEKYDIDSSSILVGKVENIQLYLEQTKFFFVTSKRESFSMVILEAMACGCVVISYNCPTGPSELIDDGETGFLVEPNNLSALENVFEKVNSNQDLSQKISLRAREKSEEFSEFNVVNKWIDLIHE